MQAFCPRCGEETSGHGPRGLCAACYTGEHDLIEVPEQIAVTVCSQCGAVKVHGDWKQVTGDRELIYEVLDAKIDGDDVVAVSYTEDEESGNYTVKVLVEQDVDGTTLQQELETVIDVEQDQCETCAKFHGGYYTYKIQVRGNVTDNAINQLMDRAAQVTNKNREHFISDMKHSKHGTDIYVSTRTMAEELLKVLKEQYNVESTRSKELVGMKEGQEVYRSVIAAHIQGDK